MYVYARDRWRRTKREWGWWGKITSVLNNDLRQIEPALIISRSRCKSKTCAASLKVTSLSVRARCVYIKHNKKLSKR
ncbi:hypothetical protein PUN28_008561 [Cardiocondyla obscurior]|uniref:Uncharacterized protein n=1 Tax=Cardiocondyla obscurior TaxID=286306 RepID=A0AAW2G062_9HYME